MTKEILSPEAAIAAVRSAVIPDLCDIAAIRRILGLASLSGTRRLVLRELPHVRLGRKWYVRREALLDHLAARETRPKGNPEAAR